MKPKLLWVGDAACPSGFSRATHEILAEAHLHYDVTVLGLNYNGDPHGYPYPIYSVYPGGDGFGIGRLAWMCDLVKPDLIVLQNDPWNIPAYIDRLRQAECGAVPVVGFLAVDGLNCNGGAFLKGLTHAIFWTEFGRNEAVQGGYTGPSSVIPLGVDLSTYHPVDKSEARKRYGLDVWGDRFIVGNVNRNQPRKRWDLTIRYFAKWLEMHEDVDAGLFLHVAPTGDVGVRVKELAHYYGLLNRLATREPAVFYGVSEEEMRDTYNCFDVSVTTTQGEGFGLTTIEAMACGVPVIAPDWAALGDWAKPAAALVECTSTAIGTPFLPNVIGGVADEAQFIAALDKVYRDETARRSMRDRGLALVNEERFRWANIGKRSVDVFNAVLSNTHLVQKEI